MRTDISLAKMNEFLGMRDQFLEYEIVGIPLTADPDNLLEFGFSSGGQSILRPRAGEHQWQNVHAYLDLMMQGEATAAARVATASAVVELPE
jgi:hypothetical protein